MGNCWSCGRAVQDQLNCPSCGADLTSQTRVINLSALRATPVPTPGGPALDTGDLSEDDEHAVLELPPDRALLVVKKGPQSGSRFLLDSEVVSAGRASDNDIFLDDVSVSRKHAQFLRSISDDGSARFKVVDVGSLNGTYVNRNRIDSVELTSGDEVQIGKFRLVFYPGVAR